jgi:hypothetical protein
MFAGLVPLAVVVIVIVVIVRLRQDRGAGLHAESAGEALRRFFVSLLLLAAVLVAAFGAAGVVEAALPGPGPERAAMARSLAFLVVGLPAAAWLGWLVRRRFHADPAEGGSLGWAMYLYGVLLTSLGMVMYGGARTVQWALGALPEDRFGDAFDPSAAAALIVWLGVWAAHWLLAARSAPAGRLQPHLLAGSAAGLAVGAASAGVSLGLTLSWLYGRWFDTQGGVLFGDELRSATAVVVVGAVVWAWYWLARARRSPRTLLWHAYTVLLGVLGGMITVVVGISIVIDRSLVWWFGDPQAAGAAAHFEVLPGAAAAALAGAAVWAHHRLVLGPRHPGQRNEMERAHDYVAAGAGLLTAAAGITILLVGLIETLTPGQAAGTEPAASNTLMLAVTLLVVGGPLWGVFWRAVRRHRAADPQAEVASPSRRAYLFVLFGASAAAALGSLIAIMVTAFDDLLGGTFGSASVLDVRIPMALVVTTGVLAGFHWVVYRSDRRIAPAAARPEVREVVLVCCNGAAPAEAIRDRTGARVRVWRTAGTVERSAGDADVAEVVAAEPHERVLVIARPEGGYEVIPFEEPR